MRDVDTYRYRGTRIFRSQKKTDSEFLFWIENCVHHKNTNVFLLKYGIWDFEMLTVRLLICNWPKCVPSHTIQSHTSGRMFQMNKPVNILYTVNMEKTISIEFIRIRIIIVNSTKRIYYHKNVDRKLCGFNLNFSLSFFFFHFVFKWIHLENSR